MKFICLVYAEPGFHLRLSPEERAKLDRDSLAYDEELGRLGQLIAASALQPVATASTIRVRGGKVMATDGPFAETKEVLCGFVFVEAATMSEAKAIAERIPMARYGTIEVRAEMDIG